MSKQFGLIIPGQKKQPISRPRPPTKPSIFDESSESSASEENAAAPQKRPTGKPGGVSGPSLMERRVARNMQEKALAEDPTIFQYDELYDDMDNKREEAKETKRLEPRKAKYIGRLMEHAERRKLENELRVERQVQKDREAEGEKYKDKDTYVTTAYRKKLESIRLLQEQDQREEYLEAIGDVTKQKDLDGFYRHLYEQKLGNQKEPVLKPKTAPSTDEVAYKPIKSELPTTSTSSSTKQRSYRRRRASEDEELPVPKDLPAAKDESKPGSNKAHLPNNIDADSDFSIDDSSDEDQEQVLKLEQKTNSPADTKVSKSTDTTDKDKNKPESDTNVNAEKKVDIDTDDNNDADNDSTEAANVPKVVKTPIDRSQIWRKRTIGEVFDAAVARYRARKLTRRA